MKIPATSRTPEVDFSAGLCAIKGECYPEDITEFSSPVLSHLKEGISNAEEYKVVIELYYFNSSSAKFFYDFFEYLDDSACEGTKIVVVWRYREDDDTMEEAGEEFEEDLEHVNFILESIG
ncbi:MAG: Fe-S oxidoreductase [Porticoccaceae bacterium]|nr:Fe-S oxidoreductase [Porticoccaceae bacterium]|tara:strand:- start:2669 stop:3031 length:363 start_codon:yes stop_codon:yes gene_type:complete